MKAVITVNMDNAAFGDYPANELARILARLADDLKGQEIDVADLAVESLGFQLRDLYGNRVGAMEIEA